MAENECFYKQSEILIFPFLGGSKIGQIASEAAKDSPNHDRGKMYCLAGIGGKDSGIVSSKKAAKRILTINECQVNCARKTFEQAGFTPDLHVTVTDLDIKKKNSFLMDVSEIDGIIQKISGDDNEE